MTVDLHGSDPIPAAAGRAVVENLVFCVRERLGVQSEPAWQIISHRS
jgi:hypothetical protein